MAELIDSKSIQCGFESHHPHSISKALSSSLVRTQPFQGCYGDSNSPKVIVIWMITQAATGADCKSAVLNFVGASPSSSIMIHNTKQEKQEHNPMIYAYFLGLITSASVMIGFIVFLKCCA